jgi:hypothetical protein
MRILVVVAALAMPLVSYVSQLGYLGPDNGTISDRYPTLLIAAGYAFAIWGLIFLGDLVYAVWQATGERRDDPPLSRIAPWTTAGFLLTGVWSPLFTLELFWLCVAVIFAALACMLRAAILAARAGASWLARGPLSLHAGWLSLAAFLNVAQTLVAYGVLADPMLVPSLGLYAAAGVVLLGSNHLLRGDPAYVAAAVWALAAVFVKQRSVSLEGAPVAGWVALGLAGLLVLQTAALEARSRRGATAL